MEKDPQNPAPSDEAPAPSAPAGEKPGGGETPPWGDDFDPARAWKTIQSQREQEKALKERLTAFEKAQQEREDAEKTEAQRLADALEKAQSEAKAARSELLRARVAAKHGLPESVAALLTGESEEDLEAKAAALSEWAGHQRKPADDVPGKPRPRLTPGAGADDGVTPDEDPEAIADRIRASRY